MDIVVDMILDFIWGIDINIIKYGIDHSLNIVLYIVEILYCI